MRQRPKVKGRLRASYGDRRTKQNKGQFKKTPSRKLGVFFCLCYNLLMNNELVKLGSAIVAVLGIAFYLSFSGGIPLKDLSIGFLSPAALVIAVLFFVQRNKEVKLSIWSKVFIVVLIIIFLLPALFLFGSPFWYALLS